LDSVSIAAFGLSTVYSTSIWVSSTAHYYRGFALPFWLGPSPSPTWINHPPSRVGRCIVQVCWRRHRRPQQVLCGAEVVLVAAWGRGAGAGASQKLN
jgi:hypothetical protein